VSAAGVPIDTLTFEDLLRLGLEDLPGSSQGQWTLHGPVDPGISFLELFAWQFEQRLFMAEQLTEPIVRASLRLLGLADPAPATAAVTVLAVSGTGAPGHLATGTVFGLDDDVAGRRFALDEDLWVQPVDGAQVAGRLLADADVLELTLSGDTTAPGIGGALSLLVELPAVPGVSAAWRPAAVDAPGPAELRWTAVGPDGSEAAVDVEDGTGALRRPGILRVPWPDVWDRSGGEPRRLRATAVRASYTEPVAVAAVHANVAIARHRVAASTDPGPELAGFLPLPGQVLPIAGAQGLLCDGDGDVVLSMIERDGERHDWTSVRTWVGSGPADRIFVVDRGRGELRFGDGRRGRVPRPAEQPDAAVSYALGAGAAGNLGRSRTWSQEGGVALAINPVAADDGAEAEDLEAARQRAADALALRDRTVTADDARELAESTPGVAIARAHVTPGEHPCFPCDPVDGALAVTVVPYADRTAEPAAWTVAPQPDDGAVEAVRQRLEGARLLGQEVFVLAPLYRRVTVDVSVSALSDAGDASERIVAALRTYLDPLVGGSEREGWPFGGPVRPSALTGVVQDTAGVEATVTRLIVALDDGAPSDCGDLAIGERELVYLGTATVSWVAVAPPGGGLQ
jgi:Baseplate J-like protein